MMKSVEEGNRENVLLFEDRAIRNKFVRKVYGILMFQLAFTFGTMAAFKFLADDSIKKYVYEHSELMVISIVVSLTTTIMLFCCQGLARKTPVNYILLLLFTIAETFMLTLITLRMDTNLVLLAAGTTALICLAITIFAFQTSIDVTGCWGFVLISMLILMVFGIVMIFIPENRTLMLIYTSFGVLLFSFMILYDTQRMLGGKHKYAISPEDYIYAALALYLDIILLFLYILEFLYTYLK